MKKNVLILLISVFIASMGLSQSILISFDDFERAVSNVKIQGFSIISDYDYYDDEDDDYYDDYDDYDDDYDDTEYAVSMLNNAGNAVMFTMYMRTGEPTWTGTIYEFEGVPVEYSEMREMKILQADLKYINAVLLVASTGNHNKSDLESFFKSTGLAKKRPATVNWLPEIPEKIRLKGTIMSINKSQSDVDGYKSDITVTAQLDENLNNSYKEIIEKYGKGETFIILPSGIIFNTPFGDVVEDLYDEKEDGDILIFQYLIP